MLTKWVLTVLLPCALGSCDYAPNCRARNRHACSNEKTCGPCIDGYTSPEMGHANLVCEKEQALVGSGDFPVIDLEALASNDQDAIDHLVYACKVPGFMYVSNHGVDQALIEKTIQASKKFFAMELERKIEVGGSWSDPAENSGYVRYGGEALDEDGSVGDPKESYDMNSKHFGKNSYWNETTVPAYFEAMHGVKDRLLAHFPQAFRKAFPDIARKDIPEDFFTKRHVNKNGVIRLLHYPPVKDAKTPRAAPHSDYGTITILFQDDIGGLEVFNRETGQWQELPFKKDTLVVNLADLLQRWTNDYFQSTMHRVMPHTSSDSCQQDDRYSIAMFIDPDYEKTVDPSDLVTEKPNYPPVESGAYLVQRLSATHQPSN